MNIQLPSTTPPGDLQPNFPNSLTGEVATLLVPMQLPIYVTVSGVASQAGVYLSVAPKLEMLAPTNLTMLQLEPWTTGNAVVASLGTGTITYAITQGVLPAGLTMAQDGGPGVAGVITGTPAANTAGSYLVTVTATDSAASPLTGSVTFTIVVNGGLYVSYVATPPFNASVYGTAGTGLPTLIALGGDGSFTYTGAVSGTPTALPAGMTVGGSSGIFATTGATKAGTYLVTVTATDTTTPNPITGTATFTDTIALLAVPQATTNTLVTTAGGINGHDDHCDRLFGE